MKRISLIISSALISVISYSQNESDVMLTTGNIMTGTARSMALSNAMGAIGGDMSAMSTNPAGIAVYRSSEFVYSQGFNANQSTMNYYGTTREDNMACYPLQTIGFVGTYRPLREVKSGIVSSHFSFNYNRINNYNKNITLEGNNITSSLLDQFKAEATGYTPEELFMTENPNYFGANLAYGAFLLENLPELSTEYYNTYEDYSLDINNNPVIDFWRPVNGINQKQKIDSRGYSGEYSFAGGLNISNFLMVGASFNYRTIHSEYTTLYRETHNGLYSSNHPIHKDDAELNYFEYYTYRNLDGVAVNGKVGIILKPFHMLRLGLAYHSPNVYRFKQDSYAELESYFFNAASEFQQTNYGYDVYFDYKLQTPFKLAGSAAIVLGNFAFITADYELQDLRRTKFLSSTRNFEYDDYFQSFNQVFKDYYQVTHTLKLGAEIKPVSFLMLRAGVGLYTSPIKSEYLSKPMNTYTASGGLGFRENNFSVDVAYMAIYKEEDYYPYRWSNEDNPQTPALYKSYDHRVALTLGWKF